MLDADLTQYTTKIGGRRRTLPSSARINEGNILQQMKDAYETADMILVDLPGGSSDARDAMETVAQVDDAQELRRYPIPRSLIGRVRSKAGVSSGSADRCRFRGPAMPSGDDPTIIRHLHDLAALAPTVAGGS